MGARSNLGAHLITLSLLGVACVLKNSGRCSIGTKASPAGTYRKATKPSFGRHFGSVVRKASGLESVHPHIPSISVEDKYA